MSEKLVWTLAVAAMYIYIFLNHIVYITTAKKKIFRLELTRSIWVLALVANEDCRIVINIIVR